jgi:hypothetical protein
LQKEVKYNAWNIADLQSEESTTESRLETLEQIHGITLVYETQNFERLLYQLANREGSDVRYIESRLSELANAVADLYGMITVLDETVETLAAGSSAVSRERIQMSMPATKSITLMRPLSFLAKVLATPQVGEQVVSSCGLTRKCLFGGIPGGKKGWNVLNTYFGQILGQVQNPHNDEPGFQFPDWFIYNDANKTTKARATWDSRMRFDPGAWTLEGSPDPVEIFTEMWNIAGTGKFSMHYGTVGTVNGDGSFTFTDSGVEVSVPYTVVEPGFGDDGPDLNESEVVIQKKKWDDENFGPSAKHALFTDMLWGELRERGGVKIAGALTAILEAAAAWAIPEFLILNQLGDYVGSYAINLINDTVNVVQDNLFGTRTGTLQRWVRRTASSTIQTATEHGKPFTTKTWSIRRTIARPNSIGSEWPKGQAQNTLTFVSQQDMGEGWTDSREHFRVDLMAVSHVPQDTLDYADCSVEMAINLTKPDGTVWLLENSGGGYDPVLVRWGGLYYAVVKEAGPVYKLVDYP